MGQVGICIDMGRPGMGVFLRDAEKVAMACAQARGASGAGRAYSAGGADAGFGDRKIG